MTNDNIMLLYYAFGVFGMLWAPFVLAPQFTQKVLGRESSDNITTVLTFAVALFFALICFAELYMWLR
jgi:hypothetical protein